ncbi:MAG TPA: radical SAM protein [Bacteroidales bacterium]|nr:radical SAM protein [Bacteroidales bacterium]HNS46591.1 radical SAM protein [Bacteroidales bacterium]
MSSVKHYTIPIFIPQLGCPHQCVFCNQRKISGALRVPDAAEVEVIIQKHLDTIPRENTHIEIGFFGGSFTCITPSLQKHYLSIVSPYLPSASPPPCRPVDLPTQRPASRFLLPAAQGIRVSTRPDCIDEERLYLLKEYGVTTIELGAQSMDDDVLRQSGRGHTARDTERASVLILSQGFKLGLQMMIGLPGDTLDRSLHTARRIVELGADNTRIYPTLVIKNTPLAQLYRKGEYAPLSLEEAVRWSAAICGIFENAGVTIIRMGLHPSEGLVSGKELLAGPFHPSFRELVETALWKEKLREVFLCESGKSIQIQVAPDQLNVAIGYGASNRKMLLERFRSVTFVNNVSLTGRNFYVHYSG